jgi:hypothetical protein
MRWMETIKVQSATGEEQVIVDELMALAQRVRKSTNGQGLQEAMVFCHASVPGYVALRLFWNTDTPQTRGSTIGLSLTQALKAFGLVDHSVWIEKT